MVESTAASIGEPIIVLQDVTKEFAGKTVLSHVSLECRRGETTVIIGGSGAGKTTLIRLVVALDHPTAGHILIDGEDIVGMSERALNRVRRKFGMVYQYAALLDSCSVLENVAFPLVEHTKLSKKEIKERVVDKLRILGLDPDVIQKFPAELSGGMRKRVGIARAIALRPRYILYDEPTTGLDPVTSAVMDRLMVRTREHLGVTGIVVTHDMRSAYTVGDRIAMLYEGKVRQVGSIAEIQQTADPVVRQFIEGRPE
jgi:phospholipid/cholesterol/gamma-HCH transport system ATP-binding protein